MSCSAGRCGAPPGRKHPLISCLNLNLRAWTSKPIGVTYDMVSPSRVVATWLLLVLQARTIISFDPRMTCSRGSQCSAYIVRDR